MPENREYESYSEERLNKSFHVTLLFSERLEFDWPDVFAAIAEDYPELSGWEDVLGQGSGVAGDVSMGFVVNNSCPDAKSLQYSSAPGKAGAPHEGVYAKVNTFKGAREAYERHATYLDLTVSSEGTDLESRFRAARALNCISAVFAKLPVCLAVWFPDADLILSPEAWAKAAEEARREEWPLLQWISLEPAPFQATDGRPAATISTIGMAAFNGSEVSVVGYPGEQMGDGIMLAHNACWMLLAGGSRFNDDDTIGAEGDATKIRIRLVKEGSKLRDSGGAMQTDVWMLFHPDGVFDDRDLLGPSPNAPDGVVRPVEDRPADAGWFRKVMRKTGLH